MATLTDRLHKLEQRISPTDPMRVIPIPDGGDADAERAKYRRDTDYRGLIVVMDETDRAL